MEAQSYIMNKIREWFASFFTAFAVFGVVVSKLGAIALHIFTILFAYKTSGVLAAIISLFTPILAQLYWGIKMWNITGNFVNEFSYYFFVNFAWFLTSIALFAFASLIEPKKNV